MFKAFKAFQNNGPNYWIVTDKAFGGTVIAKCDFQEDAERIAQAVNAYDGLKALVGQLGDLRSIKGIDDVLTDSSLALLEEAADTYKDLMKEGK